MIILTIYLCKTVNIKLLLNISEAQAYDLVMKE